MPDRQNTGAMRGPGTSDQETSGSGAGDDENDVDSLGGDGAQRDEWRRHAEGDETEAQREEREAAAEEHQERFSKGPVRGPI
jgi:hypothetical protein